MKKYLTTDARTEEGREYIAEHNNVFEAWKAKNDAFPKGTRVTTKCFELAKLVAENWTGERYGFGNTEGFHRCVAAIQALFGSKVDGISGIIKGPGLFTYSDFPDYGDLPDVDVPPLMDRPPLMDLQDHIEKVHRGPCKYFDQNSYVEIKYISASVDEVTTTDVLWAMREISKQVSENKLNSSKKSAFVTIGNFASKSITDLPVDNINFRPNVSGAATFLRTSAKTKVEAKKMIVKAQDEINGMQDWSKDHVESKAFKIYPFLFNDVYIQFALNPMDEEVQNSVKEHYSFPAVDNPDVRLSPPFLNTSDTLLIDAKKQTTISTWVINAAWFIPFICHYIWADLKNKPVAEVAEDKHLQQLVLYIVRYHSNAFGLTSTKIHGASQLYDFISDTNYTTQDPNDFIGAVLFISDSINTALTHPHEWFKKKPSKDVSRMVYKLKQAANTLDRMYSTIKNRSKMADDRDILYNFGKFDILFHLFRSTTRIVLTYYHYLSTFCSLVAPYRNGNCLSYKGGCLRNCY